MSSSTPNTSLDANKVFAEARDALLNSLTPTVRAHFAACPSAADLIEHVRNDERLSRNKTLLRRALSRLDGVNTSLSFYFTALDMFPQSNPEFAAIAWGALKLVLQLASNFNSFFEKLLRTLGRFAEEFPQYDHLISQFKNHPLPSRLQQSLVNLYSDLLRFLQSIIGIFARKDGTMRRSHAIFADICWKPYDLRFDNFLSDLRFHSQIVKTELQFGMYHELREMHIDMQQNANELTNKIARTREEESTLRKLPQKLTELQDKVEAAQVAAETMLDQANAQQTESVKARRNWNEEREERHRIETVTRARSWLDPPQFALDFERAIEIREEGTSEWLFSEPKFARWRGKICTEEENSDGSPWSNAFWIHGNLGCGKTVLAASTVEDFREVERRDNTCYFFFRADTSESNSCVQAYKSILAQTLQQHRSDWILLNRFIFVMDQDSSGQKQATRKELIDLLRNCAQAGFIQQIILDGIDESCDHAILIKDISSLLSATSVKTLLFSRLNVDIPEDMPDEHRFNIGQLTSGDIQTFLERKLIDLVARRLLPSTANINQLRSRLVTGANGMFIWARLMVNYLNSYGLTVTKRLQEIENVTLPEGLDKMYDRVFELLSQGTGPDRDLGKWIIMWLSCMYRTLTADELKATVKVKTAGRNDNQENFLDFDRAVRSTCGGLVEKSMIFERHSRAKFTGYRFIHLSVSEYLERRLRCGSAWFLPSASESHLSMARSLLQYLGLVGQHVEGIRSPTEASNSPRQRSVDAFNLTLDCPLWDYALTYWSRHLQQHRTELLGGIPDQHKPRGASLGREPLLQELLYAPGTEASSRATAESTGNFSGFCSVLSSFVSRKGILMSYIEVCYLLLKETNFYHIEEWLHWAMPGPLNPDFEGDAKNSFQDGLELIAFLKELDEAWGPKLCENPYLIWDEISAFTKSRFLERTTITKVHCLSASGPISRKTSQKYLCKVSEVSNDQKLVGVLSIWPSREYEELAKCPAHQSPSVEQVYRSVSNWVARYEIWTLKTNPERTLELSIPLQNEDIWLQYQHSLSYATQSSGLALQFPISVSPCIQKFAILHNVYSSEVDERTSEVRLAKFSLPFGLDDTLASCWSPKEAANDTKFWKSSGSFFYFVVFGPTGKSVFCISRANQESQQYVNLAVFNIDVSGNPPAKLASPYAKFMPQSTGTLFCPPDTKHVLHPNLPLAIFTISGFAYIWIYCNSESSLRTPQILGVSALRTSHPDSTLWLLHSKFYFGDERYDSITFSEDGIHVILDGKTIIRLPDYVLTACSKSSSLGSQLQTYASGRLSNQNQSPYLAGSLIRSSNYRAGADGSSTGISATISRNSLRLELLQTSRKTHSATAVELTTLPQTWKGMTDVSASISVPKTKEEIIRIILNQAAKPCYTMSDDDEVDQQLPAIIDRDMLSVRKVEASLTWTKPKAICSDPLSPQEAASHARYDCDHTSTAFDASSTEPTTSQNLCRRTSSILRSNSTNQRAKRQRNA